MTAVHAKAEPLSRLLERFDVTDTLDGKGVVGVSLAAALATASDPFGILGYLGDIGIAVSTLEDLMRVNGVTDEEELSAHRVAEGIALTIASQGEWILFRP